VGGGKRKAVLWESRGIRKGKGKEISSCPIFDAQKGFSSNKN